MLFLLDIYIYATIKFKKYESEKIWIALDTNQFIISVVIKAVPHAVEISIHFCNLDKNKVNFAQVYMTFRVW